MPDGHPSEEILSRFAAGTATAEERNASVRHLLGGCEYCAAVARAHLARPQIPPAAYDAVFARVTGQCLEPEASAARAAAAVRTLIAHLDTHPLGRRLIMARNHRRYVDAQLVEALVARSFQSRFSDTAAMLADAETAATLAARLEASEANADIQGAAYRQWGNALRIAGRFDAADEAFRDALEALEEGTGDGYAHAYCLEQLASLRRFQRRFLEARDLLSAAASFYRQVKARDLLARALVSTAIVVLYECDPRAALVHLHEAMLVMDARRDPGLALAAIQLAVRCYLDDGQPERALKTFVLARPLYDLAEPGLRLRVIWLEGQLLLAHGHLEPAREAFEQVREDAIAGGRSYEMAMVSLDLAEALSRLGLYTDVRRLMRATMPTFRSLGVSREFLASVLVLTHAAQQDVYVETIRSAARAFERSPVAFALA
ncbi:MAG: hypothetical protein M3O15_05995 [Acidobacteriota bacterium]|nr:hypothetical protein [Acidobacteriota bacterium]